MDYDDRNRAFLQAFMGRSHMTFEDVQPVLAAILSVGNVSYNIFRCSIADLPIQQTVKALTPQILAKTNSLPM